MGTADWTFKEKPYDIRKRLFNFACAVVRLSRFLHTRGPIAVALTAQLLRSGTSAGANYEEADEIVLRELKETSFRLRVLRQAGILDPAHDPVIDECDQSVRIMATLLLRARRG